MKSNEVTLISGLRHITLGGPLGRGIQFVDNMDLYVTNDRDVIQKLVPPSLSASIGSLEYRALIDNHQAIYWKLPQELAQLVREKPFAMEQSLILFLGLYCRGLLHALWLVKDNAVNCDPGFLWYPGSLGQNEHASNYLPSLYRSHQGEVEETAFSESEIKQARTYNRGASTTDVLSITEPIRPDGCIGPQSRAGYFVLFRPTRGQFPNTPDSALGLVPLCFYRRWHWLDCWSVPQP
ncbi:MAG: hypothetical protein EXS36_12960 [Pedosphaera sp.]|nr:hypothetical protein [Pedosphaera sp.]